MKAAEEFLINHDFLLGEDENGDDYKLSQDDELIKSLSPILREYAEYYHNQQMVGMMPEWRNINTDDFIAEINGYTLRVEQMDASIWWYSVGIGVLELCNETNAGSKRRAKRFAEGVYLKHYIESLLTKEE